MTAARVEQALVCYMSGVDLRRLDPKITPYLSGLIKSFPTRRIRGLPSSEVLSTVLTGMWPHHHRIWQARLKPDAAPTFRDRVIDLLPETLTTSAQCVLQALGSGLDMATMPPTRRRELEFTRLKFRGPTGTEVLRKKLAALGSPVSIVSALGNECRYFFTDRFNDRDRVVASAATGNYRLELIHFHAMDILGHWYLDTEEKFRRMYALMDEFLKRLHDKCRSRGITFAVLSDHGQERIREAIDLKSRLRKLNLSGREYAYFMQAVMTRFWFRTERSRRAVLGMLSETPNGTVLANQALKRYQIEFPDTQYGEVYFLADPGYLFFPDDFYHPLANVYFGLKDWQKRRRLGNPVQLGYHGYLPDHESETGFLMIANDAFGFTGGDMQIVDVAPTLLAMVGSGNPAAMDGISHLRDS